MLFVRPPFTARMSQWEVIDKDRACVIILCYFVVQQAFVFPASVTQAIWQKVKCTLVQALRLCTDRTAHRGSRGIALLFLDHGTKRGWGVSVTPRPLFIPRKDSVPIVQEAGWAPRPVWTGAENLAPIGIRSPERPARSQSLYRLSYRGTLHRPYGYWS